MRISESSPLSVRDTASGYSMLEVIVVVAIMATAVTLAAPSLGRMVERYEAQAVLNGIDRRLLELRVLSATEARAFNSGQINQFLQDDLANGWRVTVSDNVQFSSYGICTGGRLNVLRSDGREMTFSLDRGDCFISRNAAG